MWRTAPWLCTSCHGWTKRRQQRWRWLKGTLWLSAPLHWLALDCCLLSPSTSSHPGTTQEKRFQPSGLKSSKSRVVFTFLLRTPPLTQGCLLSYSRLLVVSGCCYSLFLLLPDSLGSVCLFFLFPYLLLYASQRSYFTQQWTVTNLNFGTCQLFLWLCHRWFCGFSVTVVSSIESYLCYRRRLPYSL